MATNFPGGVDEFNNPSPSTAMNATGYEHGTAHANLNDAVEAIQVELGINTRQSAESVSNALSDLRSMSQFARAINGRYYNGGTPSTTFNTALMATNTIYCAPIAFGQDCTADSIGLEVTTFASGSRIRTGIFKSSSRGLPGVKLVDVELNGGNTIESNGGYETTISQALGAGKVYWLVYISSGGNTARTANASASHASFSSITDIGNAPSSVATDHTYGTMPSDLSNATFYQNNRVGTGCRIRVTL